MLTSLTSESSTRGGGGRALEKNLPLSGMLSGVSSPQVGIRSLCSSLYRQKLVSIRPISTPTLTSVREVSLFTGWIVMPQPAQGQSGIRAFSASSHRCEVSTKAPPPGIVYFLFPRLLLSFLLLYEALRSSRGRVHAGASISEGA